MNKLDIQQSQNVEIVPSSVIQKLYTAALNTTNATLSGNLQVTNTYRKPVEYLRNRFENLTINVTGDYFVDFEDSVFKQIVASYIGDGTDTTETAAQAANDPRELLYRCSNSNVTQIDLTPFTSYKTLNTENSNSLLSNVTLSELNFGSIENIWCRTYMDFYYNTRVGDNVIANTVIGENIKNIGYFSFRGFIFTEGYFPNVEQIGSGVGKAKDTINGTEYARKFIFLGDKLEKCNILFADENASNDGIIVITATTPPTIGSWDNNGVFTEEASNYFSDNSYKVSAYDYYVPDSALTAYQTATNWKDIVPRNRAGNIYPISQLPDEYKTKISRWYTIPE